MHRDPAEEGLNLYENVESNPVNMTDPMGLQAVPAYSAPTLRAALEAEGAAVPDGAASRLLARIRELNESGDPQPGKTYRTTVEVRDGNAQTIVDSLNSNQRCAVVLYFGHNHITDPNRNGRTLNDVFNDPQTGLSQRHQPSQVSNKAELTGDVRGKTLKISAPRQNTPDTTRFGCYVCSPSQYLTQLQEKGYSLLAESSRGWAGQPIKDSAVQMLSQLNAAVEQCRRMRSSQPCECKAKIIIVFSNWPLRVDQATV
jgi:hypothetical protein